jgi:hypothetical protein
MDCCALNGGILNATIRHEAEDRGDAMQKIYGESA